MGQNTIHVLIRSYLFLVAFLIYFSVYAKADTLVLVKKIPINVVGKFTIDKFKNSYHYYKNELVKYDSVGTIKNKYSNKLYGDISFVDVTNPLKILIFYKENSIVVLLDNTLSEQSKAISLQNVGVEFIQHACISQNNGFWIYDPQKFELKRYDENLNILSSSGNLYQITGISLNPIFFVEINNKIILHDLEKGFFEFDINGNFIKKTPCDDCLFLKYDEEEFVYIKNNTLTFYNTTTFEKNEINSPLINNKNIIYDHGFLFITEKEFINVYRMNK